ncbi:unnamed protein product [Meganyctiphanes norvegica]|uniref:Uncharacterized protein n=1 Tax=Meganyctiphanes norvegica TaxID=48144 RepID=A0AAV2PX28_MEGNR
MMRLLWVCIALCAASAVFSGTDARYNPNLLRGLRAYPKVHQNAADNGGSKGGYVKGYRPEKEQLIYIGDGSGYGSGDGSGDNPDDEDSIHPEKGVEIGTGVLPWNPEFLGEGIVPEVTEVVQFVPVTSVNYQPKTEKPNFWSSAWNNVASAVDDIGDTLGDAASNVGDKVGNWGKEVGETFNEFGENVGSTFDDWGNKLADVADDINDKIGVVIDDAQDMAQEVIIYDALSSRFSNGPC